MIPQVDTQWFLSQFFWTGLFFLIQYLLSRFIVFNRPLRHKMSKKLSIELVLEQIQSLKDDIATLKNQKFELEVLEQREREIIVKEVIEEQKVEYVKALAALREEFAQSRAEKRIVLVQYKLDESSLSGKYTNIARKLADKVVHND